MTNLRSDVPPPDAFARPAQRLFWLPRPWPIRVFLLALFIVSLRIQWVGSASYTPIFFGQVYVFLFMMSFVLLPSLIKHDVPSSSVYVVGPAAMVAAWYAAKLAPTIGERNYCSGRASSWHAVPQVFRCTSFPFGLVAFTLTWWAGFVLIEWWTARRAT